MAKTIHSEARALILKVLKFFENEKANKQFIIPVDQVIKRTCTATGISKRTLMNIKNEAKIVRQNDPPVPSTSSASDSSPTPTPKLSTPGKKRKSSAKKIELDNVDLCASCILKAHEVGDVVVASAVYKVGLEPREVLFFGEGAVVFWNCTELEANNVLDFVRPFEVESYPKDVVEKEKEIMTYVYQQNAKTCHLQESCFVLVPSRDNSLERYTFSHAMVQSARLGAWEARLESLAASVRFHTQLMERDGTTKVDKKEVVRKLGELFSLRHRLNVESDLLDTPDFYWEEEQLERLYSSTVAYFTISRRTRVLNERLSHCAELLELLSTWAADRHHIRLEWMIIVLILVEVCFELLHFAERYLVSHDEVVR